MNAASEWNADVIAVPAPYSDKAGTYSPSLLPQQTVEMHHIL